MIVLEVAVQEGAFGFPLKVIEELVTDVSPVEAKDKVYAFPKVPLIPKLENVATPLTAVAEVEPISVPPDPLAIETVTTAELPVTVKLLLS